MLQTANLLPLKCPVQIIVGILTTLLIPIQAINIPEPSWSDNEGSESGVKFLFSTSWSSWKVMECNFCPIKKLCNKRNSNLNLYLKHTKL